MNAVSSSSPIPSGFASPVASASGSSLSSSGNGSSEDHQTWGDSPSPPTRSVASRVPGPSAPQNYLFYIRIVHATPAFGCEQRVARDDAVNHAVKGPNVGLCSDTPSVHHHSSCNVGNWLGKYITWGIYGSAGSAEVD